MDILYIMSHVQPAVLITHLIFFVPVIGTLMRFCGAIPSKNGVQDENAVKTFIKVLTEGERPLILLPGGAWEFSKSSAEKHQILWKKNPGYARLVVENIDLSKTQVVPFFTKNCENIFWNTPWWHDLSGVTIRHGMDLVKQGYYILIPPLCTLLVFSVGFFIIPRPVKLDAYFGKPLIAEKGESAEDFNARVTTSLKKLIDDANNTPDRESVHPNGLRGMITSIEFFMDGILMLTQNLVVNMLTLTLIWTLTPLPLLVFTLMKRKKKMQ